MGKIFSKLFKVLNEKDMKIEDISAAIFELIKDGNGWFPDTEGTLQTFYDSLKPKNLAIKVN